MYNINEIRNTILCGNAIDILKNIPDESVHECVNSPPYWTLRSYKTKPYVWGGDKNCNHEWGEQLDMDLNRRTHVGGSLGSDKKGGGRDTAHKHENGEVCLKCNAWRGELGTEPTPQMYISHLVEIFKEIKRVLRKDGTLWVVIGDCYTPQSSHKGGTPYDRFRKEQNWSERSDSKDIIPSWGKAKDLVGIPWRFAFAMQDDGWWLRNDIIWCLGQNTDIYVKSESGIKCMIIKDLYRTNYKKCKLWDGKTWNEITNMIKTKTTGLKIHLRNGEEIICTTTHIFPTQRGLIKAENIKPGDIIDSCKLPEPENQKNIQNLPDYETGWFIGLYLAEGSRGHNNRCIQIASHSKEEERYKKLKNICDSYDCKIAWHKYGNKSTMNIYSKILDGIIATYITGKNAKTKHLLSPVWNRSNVFLKGILDGYLHGDGHRDILNNRFRLGFTNNKKLNTNLRTICARLGYYIIINNSISKCNNKMFKSYKGQIKFNKTGHGNDKQEREVINISPTKKLFFYDITLQNEPHLFALSSGTLTHNSKNNPLPSSVEDRCVSSHEHCFLFTKSGDTTFWTHRDKSGTRKKPQPDYRYYDKINKVETIHEPPSWKTELIEGTDEKRWKRYNLWKGHDYYFDHLAIREPATVKNVNSDIKYGGTKYPNKKFGGTKYPGEANNTYSGNDYIPTGMRNKRDVWQVATESCRDSHFAVYPRKLILPMILAGTSEHGVCSSCGAPYTRITKKSEPLEEWKKQCGADSSGEYKGSAVKQYKDAKAQNASDVKRRILEGMVNIETIGWVPSCNCIENSPLPAIIIDPFFGAGTTGIVAGTTKRDYIGIELNPEFIKLAYERIPREIKKDKEKSIKNKLRTTISTIAENKNISFDDACDLTKWVLFGE